MKSSNPQVMVQAYRLLVNRLQEEGLKPYPLHLGVTEAGDGEDGRIKSSVGIGTLLEDGLGDTIRVSLTEEPEAEIPVAYALARRYDALSEDERARCRWTDAFAVRVASQCPAPASLTATLDTPVFTPDTSCFF